MNLKKQPSKDIKRRAATNFIDTGKLNSFKDINYDFDESDYCIFM